VVVERQKAVFPTVETASFWKVSFTPGFSPVILQRIEVREPFLTVFSSQQIERSTTKTVQTVSLILSKPWPPG
jgi:hypothetical protein